MLFDANSPISLRRGRFRYFPVVPGRAEFAQAVRDEIRREPPAIVAVELPSTLEESFQRAVKRLPEISIIIYDDEASGDAVYVPVEVSDPFVEGLRTAAELELQTVFLDPDLSERPHVPDDYPDVYAVDRLGLEKYVEAYRFHSRPRGGDIAVHAEGVAWKLQGCDPEAEILVVVSLNLLDALIEAMERPQTQPLRKAKRQGVRVLNLHPDSLAETLTDMPFLQAVYEARRGGKLPQEPAAAPVEREAMGFIVVESRRQDPKAVALASVVGDRLDRQGAHFRIFTSAEQAYEKTTGESISHWQRRMWSRYSRNLALVQNLLLPPLFDLTVAARGVVDDNFAWELWETGAWYPHQKAESDLGTAKVSGDQMWVDRRMMRLRKRTPSRKGKPKPVGLKGRKAERFPGEWESDWRGTGICSYPPEDLVIESYGDFLKKKGKSILSEERARVEPFTTSTLDGIDLRETLRNWHAGKKIYVRENQKITGEVGAVVIIFDQERDQRYPYCITWLGEHQNESDMAFYATDPFENFVGPGIGRGEYGGLLLSLPSRRMADVWSDWDYAFTESKAERLLAAALDYSLEKIIVYVAPQPPRSLFKTIANRLGRKLIYIPIRQLSPIALKKVRVMHVLDGHERRQIAKDYVW